jgi:hypothetical protein
MKPVFELGDFDVRRVTISLTGDGRREQSLLRGFAERFNGDEFCLQLPSKGPPHYGSNRQPANLAGFSALQAIRTYASAIKCLRYLFIVDKEYVRDIRNFPSALKQNFVGFSQVEVTILGQQAFLVTSKLGLHDIVVLAVVCGETKCIEENITELILLELGLRVKPRKPDIDSALRQKRISLYELVRNARLENLKCSFPDLTAAFANIEQLNPALSS